jgi:hypothetical protein
LPVFASFKLQENESRKDAETKKYRRAKLKNP